MKRMRLFKSITTLAVTTLSIFTLASCSNDDNIVTEEGKMEVSGEHFTFTTEDFNTDEGATRASIATDTATKPQVVDLGDGFQAEVSIQRDAKAPVTRATAIGDGHYTIYAIDAATGTRVTGVDSKVSGTVSGGTFTKDAGTRLKLTSGTYTFVCFNDAVTDNGTTLTVNNGADALIGTTTETISGADWKVNFTMKHQTARIRFNIVSYTNEGTGITASLTSGSTYDATHSYNVDASSSTATTTAAIAASQTFPTSGTVVNSPIVQTYNNATDYNYLLPGVAVNDLTLNFTAGTIYGKSLAGKAIALTNATKTLARNGSYTINVKLKTFPYYLFEDGTIGALGDKGSRTPIGLVAREKTGTVQGMAVALKSAGNYIWGKPNYQATKQLLYPMTAGTNFTSFDDYLANGGYSGYELTWDANTSMDNKVKGNEQTDYPSFYYAGHYNPGIAVTGLNVGKWFFPSNKDWIEFGLYHGGTKSSDFSTPSSGMADITGIDIDTRVRYKKSV